MYIILQIGIYKPDAGYEYLLQHSLALPRNSLADQHPIGYPVP